MSYNPFTSSYASRFNQNMATIGRAKELGLIEGAPAFNQGKGMGNVNAEIAHYAAEKAQEKLNTHYSNVAGNPNYKAPSSKPRTAITSKAANSQPKTNQGVIPLYNKNPSGVAGGGGKSSGLTKLLGG